MQLSDVITNYWEIVPLRQLLKDIAPNLSIFWLNHRPTEIEIHSKLPIDIQISAHTHNGQIFPANLTTKLIYCLNYGYEKIGYGHYFATSSYGFLDVPYAVGLSIGSFIININGKP